MISTLEVVFAETTIVDHLLWGVALGLSLRLVQWVSHRRRARPEGRQ